MVFEKFVVQLLDKYLSKYIENLDYKRLKIDMWNGHVELENLFLKPNALADFNLPVIIKTGYLQKLTLQIPWTNLYTSSTKFTIDGFYMLLIPKIEVEYDAKQDENDQHKSKMKEVEKLEKLRKEKENLENKIEENNDTFGARMKLQIIQNLELSIHNIHIVYEDKTTKPNHPFAFGITLNSMIFQTTNDKWIPKIINENTPVIHKLGELNALAIYWNSNIKPNSNELIENLQAKIAIDNKQSPKDMSYIFRPFNVKAKLMMTLKPRQQNFEKPMFHISINLEHISLNLTRIQYLDILDLLEYQDYQIAKLKYIKYRPRKFDNIVEKWKFAFHAIVNEIIKPRLECYQWKNIKNHSNYCKEYRSIYFQGLLGKISDEQKQRAEALEKKLDVFNLTYIRRRAQIEVQKRKHEEPKTFWNSISNWWGNKSKQTEPEFDLEKVLSDEEKRKFYETIGYEGEDTSTLTYPKEYIDIDLTIRLIMLELNIWAKIHENDQQFRILSHASIPNADLVFRRRPATSSALFLVSLGSFQVFGISIDSNQSNETRPILIQPAPSNNPILLQAEFEINPIDKDTQYRVQIISQSLEIKYHAPTINKLIQCFEKDTRLNLQGVRQAAYITYNDVKQRSMLIMKSNIQKMKGLDVYINLQSSYFLLPENGIYYDGCPVICMDMGHIIFQCVDNEEELIDNYTQFRLELKNLQLLYSNKNENWQHARHEENTRLHIIKPITLYTNIFKCIHSDNIHFPVWKIAGEIPEINIRISDTRLYQILEHIQSLSLPESTNSSMTSIEEEIELWMPIQNTPETFQTIEILTKEKEPYEFKAQLIIIEGNFQLTKIDLILEEEKNNKEKPFLRISFLSIYFQTFVKKFDIEFQASLDNLIIYHEQFITTNNHHLRFLTAQYDANEINSKKLVTIHILHTSSKNPLFTTSPYNEIENKIRIHWSKLVMTLQLEAILSLMRFRDNIMKQLSNKNFNEQIIVENRTISTKEKSVKNNNNLTNANTFEIEADLEEFRIIIATIDTQMFDVYVQGVTADIHRKLNQTIINLSLTDFRIFDPNINARYQKIISQQNGNNELLSVSMILYDHPKSYIKALDDIDCYVKLNFAKANIIFLYKYIDQIMVFLDALSISMAALEFNSNQVDLINEHIQNQAFKLLLDATFNAPDIIIPINSSSNEALLLDLGKLNLQTKFLDDTKTLLVEHQEIFIENILASRIKLNEQNEIQSEIILLDCVELKIDIKRLLYHEKVKNQPYLSVKMEWDLIHFRLAQDDYLCVMKILMENFSDRIAANVIREQYVYQQEQQKQEEDELRNAVIKKQREWQIGQILENMKVHAEIKKILLTLYLGETSLIDRHVQHNEILKFANIEIDIFEIIFRQSSDMSYKTTFRIKNFQCDDLRETHQTDAVKHIIDRHITVDSNTYMLIGILEFKPKSQTYPMAQRQLIAQLQSLYICIKLDYLMILQNFFMTNLSTDNIDVSKNRNDSSIETLSSFSDNDVETKVQILVKNPEMILLEDQHNSHSYCLALNFTFNMHAVYIKNNTKLSSEINDLTIYSSNFGELEYSKIKYRILQPAKVNLTLIIDPKQQKIDVQMSDIIVNIAPAVFRIFIGVMNTLGKHQLSKKQENFDIQTMFNHKSLNEANFWFLKQEKDYDDLSSDERSLISKSEISLTQQFVLTLNTVDIKLDVGFDLITKSVVAMCLSNWTVKLENWSDKLSLSSTMDIEAALYNEHTLAWEPLIEPTVNREGTQILPWNIVCSIIPYHKLKQKKSISGLNPKQLITIRTQQLLNITVTKTGINLMKNLLSILNDIYNERLPKSIDYNQPMLSLSNLTGKKIFIDHLNGLEFTDDTTWTSKVLEENERISLTALSEQSSSAYRLSVIAEQIFQNRQEFSLQINNHIKLISINRTWQRIYNLQSSPQIQILCDTQIHNNQRRIILSSIVKIFNNTILPIIILDFDLITGKSFHKIESNEDYYVPIDLLYKNSNSTILIGFYNVDQKESISDFFEFNWKETNSQEQKLQLNNDQIAHLIVYKEIKKAYAENTDQLHGKSYCIYIHSVLQLTNLLPIDIQCSIDDIEEIYLKPSQFRLITFGNKNSILRFMIPFYNEMEWISDPIDLESRKTNEWNEQIIIFHNKQDILRMVLHLDVFHETYRLSLYNPFWIVNHTDLQLEFRIGDEKMFIENTEKSYLFCPEKYQTNDNEKGQIRLHTVKKDNTIIDWSEKFSLDVIKNIGIACCKVHNDKTYMICVDILTSSFDLTKIITLSPAMVIINQTSIPIEVAEIFIEDDPNQWTKVGYDDFPIDVNEIVVKEEQNHWIQIQCDEIIPFWPQNTKDGLMYVRYAHNQKRSKPFLINKKHRTLLYMNDEERLVIFVEVIATDFGGIQIIFSDYKSGDAPVLLINHTKNQIISFAQKDDTEIQYLVPEYFVYYTWIDPLKPRMINVASNSKPKTIELSPHRGILDTYENNNDLNYVVFIDGAQTVLLFSDNQQIIEATLNIPSSTQSICRCFQLGIPDIGISIVNDRRQEELLYISLNQTIVIWVQIKKSGIKLFPDDIHIQLEEIYRIHQDLLETYPNNEDVIQTKYQMDGYLEVTFHDNIAELIDHKGEHKLAKRLALDGLWIEYIWSTTNAALYARINRIQIDNQLNCTNFPSMLYPVLPKSIDSDAVGRPFIELSIYQTKTSQSNIMYFQYFRLLIQEFAFRLEQNIILAILAFLKEEKNPMTSIINIEKDLNHISKSFQVIVKTQTDNPTGETQMYFDHIHLSPLKIHVSFLMHGTKSNKTILAEYPFGRLLLKTLKVADMKDVILRLGYYERSSSRHTTTKLINEVIAHYENQFLHQFHVIILGFDVLGNPLGLIRGLAEGVESLFYEPYKGAIEGPIEFAEGLASGVTTLVGSTVGTAAGAVSRITGAIGQGLASITFDEEYKASRIRRKERSSSSVTDIATGGTSVFMGFFDGITGVVTQPIKGAVYGGASGFAKGLGKGVIGLAAKPLGAIADFASTSMNVVQRKANHEEVIHRVRHPRLISRDGLVHLYIPHEAMGLYILSRLHREDYAKMDTYVAHIKCSNDPSCWLMATSKRILFIRESSVLDYYHVDWIMNYIELKQIPVIIPDKQAIEILFKKPRDSFEEASQSYGKLVKYRNITHARYLIKKMTNAMHSIGL